MSGFQAGTAFVEVTASFRGWDTALAAQSRTLGAFGDQVGKQVGDSIRDGIERGIKEGLGEGFAGAPAESSRKGRESGGAFADSFRSQLAAALKALPKVDLNADASDVDRKIAAVRAQLQELSTKRIGIDISDAEARAKLVRLRDELVKLGNSSPSVQVRADVAKAVLELGAFEALVRKVDGKRIEVKADADTAGASAKLAALASAASGSVPSFGLLVTAGLALGPAIIPVAAAATAALAGLGLAAAGAVAGFGVAFLALKPIVGAVQALGAADASAATDAASAATAAKAKANAIESGNAQVASSETALGNTRDTVAAAAVNAAQRVGDAQRGLADAETQSAQGIKAALGQVTSAEASLTNARESAASGAVNAAQRVSDAQRGLADAHTQAAQGVQTALAQVTSAERTLAQAQQSELAAQQALTDARKSAQQQLQDYQTQLADGALAQRGALLGIQSAKENLDKVNASGTSTQLQRDQAQLAYDQAVQHNVDLGVQQARLKASAAAAVKAGVDGSKQVVAAQVSVSQSVQNTVTAEKALAAARAGVAAAQVKGAEQVAKAQEAITTAQRAQADQARQGAVQIAAAERTLATAREGVVAAQVKGAEQVAKAQEAVATAQRAQVEQARTGAAQILTAQEAITTAQRAQADQARQGAAAIAAAQQSVANAQRSLAAAYDQTSSAGVSSGNKVKEAFAGLTPVGATFAQFIYGLKDSFRGLSEAAQTGLLPGLQEAIKNLLPAMPGLTKFVGDLAKVMGDLFVQASKALTGPFWTEFFSFIGGSAAGWLKTFAETFGNLIKGAAGLFKALAPVGDLFNDSLLKGSKSFADWAANLSTNTGFQKFLAYIKDNTPAVGKLLKDLGLAFDNIIIALAPFGPKIIEGLDKFLLLIANTDPVKLGKAIEGFAGAAVGLKGLSISLGLLDTAFSASTIGKVTTAIFALGAASAYAYEKWPAFKKVADEAAATLDKLGTDANGAGLGANVFDLALKRLTATGEDIRNKVLEVSRDMARIFGENNDTMRNKFFEVNDAIRGKVFEVNDAIRNKFFEVNDAIYNKIYAINDAIRGKVFEVNDAIRDFLLARWADISRNATDWWNGIVGSISRIWDGFLDWLHGKLVGLQDFLSGTWATISRNATDWWNGITAGISGIWDGFTRWIGEKVGGLGTFLSGAWSDIRRNASDWWDAIVGVISNAWETALGNVRGTLGLLQIQLGFAWGQIQTGVREAWQGIVDSLGAIWGRIGDTIKGPLNTVLGFIQDHFITPLQTLLDSLQVKITLPTIPQFAAGGLASIPTGAARHAAGGPVGGWSPHDRADNIPAWLTANEFVLPVAATRAIRADGGDAMLERLRTWDTAGAHADGGPVRGYADGGSVWDAIRTGIGVAARSTPIGSAISTASDIGSFASDPTGKFKELVGQLLGGIGSGVFPEVAKGALTKFGDGLGEKVKSLLAALAPPAIAGSQQADGTLVQGVPSSASAAAAVAYALSQVGTAGWYRRCLAFVNAAWGHQVPWMGTPMASDSWAAAPNKHYDTNPPAGAALYYTTGSPAGHVDLSLGGNSIASTDLPDRDRVGVVGFNTPMGQWGANYLGWAMPGYGFGGVVKPILLDQGNVVKPLLADNGTILSPGLNLLQNNTGGLEPLVRADQIRDSDISQATIMRIAAAMADVTVRTSVTASTFDHAMGALL